MAIVIAGGTVVTAAGRFRADVRVEGGRIEAVGAKLHAPGDTLLDATDCFVLPGGIDPHTHIEMPIGDGAYNAGTWHSDTVAAALGGTTTVIDMITQERGESLRDALADWQRRAEPRAVVDYSFHMGVIDPRPEVLAEVPEVVRAGVPSFKLYTAYRGRLMLGDRDLFTVMRAVARAGGLVLVHAENGDVIETLVADALARGDTAPRFHTLTRPPGAEAEATGRACRLAELAGVQLYVVHVTCLEALAEIRQARARGQPVLAEACTHHLLFTAEAFPDVVLSPPLRTEADRQALRGEIDVIASDHCPWTPEQKDRERFDLVPNGIGGVRERIPFLWAAGYTPEEIVRLTATNPARIFGLPHKGSIAPGCDADLAVWTELRPARAWEAPGSPYHGRTVTMAPRHVLVRGRPVIKDGAPAELDSAGWGRFQPR